MRNRLSNIDAKNKRFMTQVTTELSRRIGFRVAPGFSERVIFREMFLQGLTVLDIMETSGNASLSLSHVAARQEVRDLLKTLQIPLITDRLSKTRADETKPDATEAKKPEAPEAKTEEKAEAKTAPKLEPEVQAKQDAKTDAKLEAKVEMKAEPVISAMPAFSASPAIPAPMQITPAQPVLSADKPAQEPAALADKAETAKKPLVELAS
jgi:hypothetical protein